MRVKELLSRSVINLNKPSGPTSRAVTEKIRKSLECKKAGHAGTLDAKVTGVLVVALDNATKIIPVLMGLDKEYEGVMYLHRDVDLQTLVKTIEENFVGEITQIPPVKSRVARNPRIRRIYSFNIIDKIGQDVMFKTKVQAGTYIRKLVSDVGEKLGIGAHLKELTRTRVGHFSIKESVTLEEIEKKKSLKKILISMEDAIPHVTKVFIKDGKIDQLLHGAPVYEKDTVRVDGTLKIGDNVGIFSEENRLLALGKVKDDERLLIKTDRII